MAYTFTSLDGIDNNNVRAEVRVEVGEGVVESIDEKDKSAQLIIKEDHLKLPVKGWVGKDTDLFRAAKKAHENGHRISYRIEVQRKPSVDRTLPINEVRGEDDAKKARDNTIRIFAGLTPLEGDERDVYVESPEAVTSRTEDPVNGRHKATGASPAPSNASNGSAVAVNSDSLLEAVKAASDLNVDKDILATVVGVAIAHGADPEAVFKVAGGNDRKDEDEVRPERRNTFASEAPLWKEWNSDGSQNLGASRFAAGIGAEHFVREELSDLDESVIDEAVVYFAKLVLSIADQVQIKSYGPGYRADRGSNSHSRIRGVVYDTIRNFHPIPVEGGNNPAETIKTWVTAVGGLSYKRFMNAIQITDAPTSFKEALPAGLFGEVKADVAPVTAPVPVVASPAPATAPVAVEEPAAPAVTEPVVEAPVVSAPAVDDEPIQFAPQENLEGFEEEEKAGPVQRELLMALAKEAGLDKNELKLVSGLLKYTFGVEKVDQVPTYMMEDFIDFYTTTGPENFARALRNIPA